MNNHFKYYCCMLICVTFFFSGCKKDEKKEDFGPVWSAKVNGRAYESTNSKGTMTFINSTKQRNFHAGGFAENQGLSIFFIDTIMNQYMDNNPMLNRIGPSVLYVTSNSPSWQYTEVSSFVTFTKFDTTAKLIDGIFGLVTINNSTNSTVTISDGKFKNIPYVVKFEN